MIAKIVGSKGNHSVGCTTSLVILEKIVGWRSPTLVAKTMMKVCFEEEIYQRLLMTKALAVEVGDMSTNNNENFGVTNDFARLLMTGPSVEELVT